MPGHWSELNTIPKRSLRRKSLLYQIGWAADQKTNENVDMAKKRRWVNSCIYFTIQNCYLSKRRVRGQNLIKPHMWRCCLWNENSDVAGGYLVFSANQAQPPPAYSVSVQYYCSITHPFTLNSHNSAHWPVVMLVLMMLMIIQMTMMKVMHIMVSDNWKFW